MNVYFDEIEYNKRQYKERTEHPFKYWLKNAYWATYRYVRWEIPYWHKRIKWTLQRVRRGWSDYDAWDLDIYLDTVIRDTTKYLSERTNSYPPQLTFDEWKSVLRRISFLADQHLAMVNNDFKYTHEEYDRTVKELFDLLSKHWGNLWD